MNTVTLEVGGLFEELDHLGVERQLRRMPGVRRASANPASGSVTVEYDEAVTGEAALREKVLACGYHCRGEAVPDVLLSGDHARVDRWRRQQSLLRTLQRRPDMLARAPLTDADRKFLDSIQS